MADAKTFDKEDAAAIGYAFADAAQRIRDIDKITPGACIHVKLFVDGVEYRVLMQVEHGE